MVLFTDINPASLTFLTVMVMGLTDLIAPGAGIAGSIIGHFSQRKLRKTQEELNKAQATLARQQAKSAKSLRGRQTQLHAQTQSITSQLLPRLQALMSGDREALTQQVAPQLQQLTGARDAAQRRIEQGGPPSGAQVQSQLELEKSNFAERNRLLSAAPQEAQAGMTQLLQLLFGAASQAGQGAANAASVASGTFRDLAAADTKNRFLNLETLSGITQSAIGFGKKLFKPKSNILTLPGSSSGAPNVVPSQALKNLLGF